MITYSRRSLRLYLANRQDVLAVPLYTLAALVLLSVLVSIVIGIATGFPLSVSVQDGFRASSGTIWALPGFLATVGIMAATRNFAMALAFGSTRRHFWLGTMAGFVLTAAVTGVGAVVALGLERLTGHWFVGAYALDVAALGNGNVAQTLGVVFVVALVAMTAGAMFGTVYRAFGAKTTALLGVACVVLLFVAIAVIVGKWGSLGPLVDGWGAWAGVAVGAVLIVVTAAGSYAACQRASV